MRYQLRLSRGLLQTLVNTVIHTVTQFIVIIKVIHKNRPNLILLSSFWIIVTFRRTNQQTDRQLNKWTVFLETNIFMLRKIIGLVLKHKLKSYI